MPIKLHLALVIVSNIVALIAGFILGMSGYEVLKPSLPELLQNKQAGFIVFGLIPAALGYYVSRFIFHFIPGKCPKCGSHATYRPSATKKNAFGVKQNIPVTYHCKGCGYIHRTKVFPHHRPDVT
ncbi:MAG TPA: hypothetical protein VIM93_00890 [Kangiella sp.]